MTTGNSNMFTQTGSTCISKSIIDIVEIPTAYLGVRPYSYRDREESFARTFHQNRQPEIAFEIGNSYIAETITDNIEIATANLGCTTMDSSKNV